MKNWYQGNRFPTLGDGHIASSWAWDGTIIHSLRNGGTRTALRRDIEGVFVGEVDEFIARVKDLGGRLVGYQPAGRKNSSLRPREGEAVVFVWDSGALNAFVQEGDTESSLSFTTEDEVLFEALTDLSREFLTTKAGGGRVYVMIATEEGLKLKSMGVASVPLEEANYNPAVIKEFQHVIDDLQSPTPCGRIIILDGPPGTGKTYLVKGLLEAANSALFVIVGAHLIAELTNPGMINALLEVKKHKGDAPVVFVIEDADHALVPRGGDNMPSLSSLLNFGDGILGGLIDLRIVCTTNAKRQDMDDAIMRPGRLCRRIEVKSLEPEVAAAAYTRLTGKTREFTKRATLAEVYRLARDEGYEPPAEKRVGFGS